MPQVKKKFYYLFFIFLIGLFFSYLFYHFFSYIFYVPMGGLVGGKEVFLLPRFIGGQNDISSGVFSNWWSLSILAYILIIFLYFLLNIANNKKISFSYFLIIIYVAAIIIEFSFLSLTHNGFNHLRIQSQSINNGIWSGMNQIESAPGYKDLNILSKIKYVYFQFGPQNNYGLTSNSQLAITGATHPPGQMLICLFLKALSENKPLNWGILITLLNTFSLIFLALSIKELFSLRIAKYASIFSLFLPSVCIHFCAVIDGISTLFISISIWLFIKTIKFQESNQKFVFLKYGLFIGLFCILAAQMSYGLAMPILSLFFSFFIVNMKRKIPHVLFLFIGNLIIICCFLYFEYIVSGNFLFWIERAFKISNAVKIQLTSRPLPLSSFSNFVVMNVWGGIFYFCSLLLILSFITTVPKNIFIKKITFPPIKLARLFILLSTTLMLFLLIFQTTARLEVERIWHWFFIPVWLFSPYFLISIELLINKLSFKKTLWKCNKAIFFASLLQIIVTLAIAITIQDYY